MRIVFTVLVIVVWLVLMFGNVAGAGRTAAQMQLKDGILLGVAQRRTSLLVLVWAVLMSAAAAVALVLIW